MVRRTSCGEECTPVGLRPDVPVFWAMFTFLQTIQRLLYSLRSAKPEQLLPTTPKLAEVRLLTDHQRSSDGEPQEASDLLPRNWRRVFRLEAKPPLPET
jgi:hypothetical protein